MTITDSAFHHLPELKDKITPVEGSQVRLSYRRFEEIDVQAKEEGWPPGWRMDHNAREANRRAVLDGRRDQELWVFAYGSLIWDPAIYFAEIRRASLSGWSRRFCMRLLSGRGSQEQPGLMAALDCGGNCEALAFRIPGELVEYETELLWMREMFSGAYCPVFMPVDTPQGPIEALVFVMNHDNERYEPDLSDSETSAMIARATGNLGDNFAYLDSLVRHLDDLGIEDRHMSDLHAMCEKVRGG
ncbi:MAG: gamma-glutamylcyclotransferase [Arenibacterium sp.]